ncbi:hypothetical protein M011DRAFT_481718 [Sporormia fimetaria CBS 119925]|uniref:Life-span regulatory factor domain-containing protein n=1 Tax=Sporormia fimetaria CBS 119925 TaxID=1340428 RepID=A0A6A6UY37_9PLEO|nr:hypothetical protein M011DRAFT_481718 [Sporormia fimetaria CBS 119925]
MSSHFDWSHDFCLACDRQLEDDGNYCSQACRLADIEKAGSFKRTASKRSTISSSASNLSSSASSTSSNQGFYLPPAVNFPPHKAFATSKGFDMEPARLYYYTDSNSSYSRTNTTSAHKTASSTRTSSHKQNLTPSSSGSSLSSTRSHKTSSRAQTASGISAEAERQLADYARAFDTTRWSRYAH